MTAVLLPAANTPDVVDKPARRVPVKAAQGFKYARL